MLDPVEAQLLRDILDELRLIRSRLTKPAPEQPTGSVELKEPAPAAAPKKRRS